MASLGLKLAYFSDGPLDEKQIVSSTSDIGVNQKGMVVYNAGDENFYRVYEDGSYERANGIIIPSGTTVSTYLSNNDVGVGERLYSEDEGEYYFTYPDGNGGVEVGAARGGGGYAFTYEGTTDDANDTIIISEIDGEAYMPPDTIWSLTGQVTARKTDGDGDARNDPTAIWNVKAAWQSGPNDPPSLDRVGYSFVERVAVDSGFSGLLVNTTDNGDEPTFEVGETSSSTVEWRARISRIQTAPVA